MALSGQLTCL